MSIQSVEYYTQHSLFATFFSQSLIIENLALLTTLLLAPERKFFERHRDTEKRVRERREHGGSRGMHEKVHSRVRASWMHRYRKGVEEGGLVQITASERVKG